MGDKGGHGLSPRVAAFSAHARDFQGQDRLPDLPGALPAFPSPLYTGDEEKCQAGVSC